MISAQDQRLASMTLSSCKALAAKLTAANTNPTLTFSERSILEDFGKLFFNYRLHREALSIVDAVSHDRGTVGGSAACDKLGAYGNLPDSFVIPRGGIAFVRRGDRPIQDLT